MQIRVNGEDRAVQEGTTVAALLESLGIPVNGVAVERNKALVRKADFAATALQPGDAVEIVSFVGGG